MYLLLFNIFVYPIAWGGNIIFDGTNDYIDYYISKGNENYKKYVEYANNHDIKTSDLYKFLGNHRGNASKSIKTGRVIPHRHSF